MKKTFTLLLAALFTTKCIHAQNTFPATGAAGIGTTAPNVSSLLEIKSTTKGFLPPRMTLAQRNAIATPATGLLIYQTNSTPGLYYYSGTAWMAVSVKGANTSLSNLNASTAINASLLPGISDSINLGSPALPMRSAWFSRDVTINGITVGTGAASNAFNTAFGNSALISNTSGTSNTAIGFHTLGNNTTGYYNTANGVSALAANTTGYFNTADGAASLISNTTGFNNVAAGYAALFSNTTGNSDIAIGTGALYKNTEGHDLVAIGDSALFNQSLDPYHIYANTAVGSKALYSNTAGYANTANGAYALYSNTTGYQNTANGPSALYSNTTGSRNTANGIFTLTSNTTGYVNTATGFAALYTNTTGYLNTANGYEALYYNTIGIQNTANGSSALFSNTTGIQNTANGYASLLNNTTGNYNTANGSEALYFNTTGSNNTALGDYADANAGNYSNMTLIGNNAFGTASNQVRIGNNAVTSIGGYADWTNISDGRVKKNIKENVPGLAFINKLKPVTYNLNLDAADNIVQRPEIKDKDGKSMQEKASTEQLAYRKAKEQIVYTGFVAQEVEKAAKELSYDFSGVDAAKNDKDLYGLRYASFVVPLVKAVQELSKQNEDLKKEYDAKINAQQKEIDDLKAMITGKQTNSIAVASLEQNIPNPFAHSTTINYNLPQQYSKAKIILTDNSGKSIKEININGNGKGSVSVDASSLSNGSYHYSLYVDGKILSSKQMILAK